MIKFIDTSLFEDNATINVIIYSDDRERANKKVDALVLGESVSELRETKYETLAIVLKDNIRVAIKTMPISSNSKGQRCQYAIVDRDIINHPQGVEIMGMSIYPTTLMYHHLLKDKDIKFGEIVNIMLF